MKKLFTQVLEQVVKLTIRGETERAGRLMEKYIVAKSAVMINEENYASEDPMFPARRELQRELEDDLDTDRVDAEDGADALDGLDDEVGDGEPCPECGSAECECDGELPGADAVAKMIQDLVASGDLDEDKLAKIVDIIASDDEGVEGDGLDDDAEVPEEVPSSGDEEDLEGDLPPEEGETNALSMDSENPEDAHLA